MTQKQYFYKSYYNVHILISIKRLKYYQQNVDNKIWYNFVNDLWNIGVSIFFRTQKLLKKLMCLIYVYIS